MVQLPLPPGEGRGEGSGDRESEPPIRPPLPLGEGRGEGGLTKAVTVTSAGFPPNSLRILSPPLQKGGARGGALRRTTSWPVSGTEFTRNPKSNSREKSLFSSLQGEGPQHSRSHQTNLPPAPTGNGQGEGARPPNADEQCSTPRGPRRRLSQSPAAPRCPTTQKRVLSDVGMLRNNTRFRAGRIIVVGTRRVP
jgi:hypothetical protein